MHAAAQQLEVNEAHSFPKASGTDAVACCWSLSLSWGNSGVEIFCEKAGSDQGISFSFLILSPLPPKRGSLAVALKLYFLTFELQTISWVYFSTLATQFAVILNKRLQHEPLNTALDFKKSVYSWLPENTTPDFCLIFSAQFKIKETKSLMVRPPSLNCDFHQMSLFRLSLWGVLASLVSVR